MPSRGWYVFAAVIFFGAIASAAWLLISRVGGMESGLVQVVVPGGANLELKERGTYTIFHERTSQVAGRIYTSGEISGLRVTVQPAGGGTDVPVRRPQGSTTYSFSGRSGTAVLAFDIDAPGTYRLTAAYEDGRQQPQVVLAVGTGFVSGLLVTIAMSVGIALAGVAAALIIVLVVVLRRRRAARGFA